jgi:predicted TIM-barrel fold metal-dependent hydrolase
MLKVPPFIDAHHHLWDLSVCDYPWLMARGVSRFFGDPTPIQKTYLVTDLQSDATELPLQGSVHVQVGVAPQDIVAETVWLQSVADTPRSGGLPNAIVAYCDLTQPDCERVLEQHMRSKNLRAVRQIVGRAADDPQQMQSDALLDDPQWRANLKRVAALGLSFDLQLIPQQAARAAQVFEDVAELRVALCHCGSPWDQSPAGIEQWRRALERLAQNPNVHCKVSGFGMFDRHWTRDSIRPLLQITLATFGHARVMLGSNFPVEKLVGSYRRLWETYTEMFAHLPHAERSALFFENAKRFYRLSLPSSGGLR